MIDFKDIINKIKMGCGASNPEKPTVYPSPQLAVSPKAGEKKTNNLPVSAKNETDSSLHRSNLNASTTRIGNSKTRPKNSSSVPKNQDIKV
jgi:hypothetical protein